ncbi:MAG: zinc-binding alcohol dehydrogenase [Anaerolineae bacterium]|jgi:2-desacetyl-2-hydroxyethyl bacteriochlorophyllide A dehydrogenase|nr:zinc-binding alcohol dehydrogenase [Anaerolineae bacterium]MBT4311902.1 zinc-binding alcohol dehydrogenase [Anaerolineae bacterium]MBT4459179.1 zinc-binding alcohol dehydrogenase [Anaerolineae bacterium]MBT4841418.1 zinc-binding alcohol dehydrogenase [Anaerolineae bacterium]MBT6059655.1 zinc-binding alcohol dehydrogenase [Anaerolineae bacterium]
MKIRQALYFDGPYKLSIREEDLPVPKADQILVQTTLTAISAGTEMLFYRGQFPREMAVDASIDALEEQNDYPLKYGYMAVGVIEEVGEKLSKKLLGKRVFSFQPHQSHFLAKESDLIFIPDDIADEDAVFLPNMETAVNLVMDAKPILGERVIVFGQGIVGLLVSALLRQFPLESLVVVDPVPMRREAALALGVDAAFAPEEIDLTNFDLALELSGVPDALNAAIEKVGFSGRIIVGSWYGQKPVSLGLGGRFHRERIQIISSQVSTIAPNLSGRWDKSRRFGLVWEMLKRVRPSKLISSRIPLGEAEQAYATLDTHPQDVLQVVFEYKD